MEFLLRHKRSVMRRAIPAIRTWLADHGVREDETCKGQDPAWAMALKLVASPGPGHYAVRDGCLYKGEDLVIHRDDIRAVLWDVEVTIELGDAAELEEAIEAEAPPIEEPLDPTVCPHCGKKSKSAAGNAAHIRAKH
jgi:hypothetical protein